MPLLTLNIFVLYLRLERNHRILRSQISIVVDLPIDFAHPPCRMKHPLHDVLHDQSRPQGDSETFDAFKDSVYDMWGHLKDIGKQVIEQMLQGLFFTVVCDTQSQMFDGGRRCLPMNQISVHQSILDERRYRINVVFAHFADVFKHETETLEDAILHVHLRHAVFIHQSR